MGKAKAKTQAAASEAHVSDAVEQASQDEEQAPAPSADVGETSVAEPPPSPKQSQTPFTELEPDEQLDAVKKTMTCADHFVGLMKFEKAADKLEDILKNLEEESCP